MTDDTLHSRSAIVNKIETIPTADRHSSISKRDLSAGEHTPGPWHVEANSLHGISFGIFTQDEIAIAKFASEANARLIAAAPDMLAALRETVLQLQYLADKFGETGTGAQVLARVNAAISKATGA